MKSALTTVHEIKESHVTTNTSMYEYECMNDYNESPQLVDRKKCRDITCNKHELPMSLI